MLDIIPPEKGSKHPLFLRWPGQLPFPAFLELDLEDRVVTFTISWPNSEPAYVTLCHARRWRIDAMISRRAAVRIAEELKPLLERVCDGYSVAWDGRNHIGVLDADAREAHRIVTARLEEKRYPVGTVIWSHRD